MDSQGECPEAFQSDRFAVDVDSIRVLYNQSSTEMALNQIGKSFDGWHAAVEKFDSPNPLPEQPRRGSRAVPARRPPEAEQRLSGGQVSPVRSARPLLIPGQLVLVFIIARGR